MAATGPVDSLWELTVVRLDFVKLRIRVLKVPLSKVPVPRLIGGNVPLGPERDGVFPAVLLPVEVCDVHDKLKL